MRSDARYKLGSAAFSLPCAGGSDTRQVRLGIAIEVAERR
jgi:hypothetical protein